jgi:hypothetical protein
MRYRLMATYRGAPYEAGVGPADGAVVLFAACPPPEELGFDPAPGHWRKELRLHDVQAVWQSTPVGMFRGERCIVLDDLGDRLHIGYLGHDAYRAEDVGYWQVDRGVFELVAARDEVTDIVEERTDYPGPAGPGAAGSGSYALPPPLAADYGRPAPPPDPRSGPQPARYPDPPPPHSGPQQAAYPAAPPAPRSGPQPVSAGADGAYLAGAGRPEAGRRAADGGGVALPPPAAGPPLPLEAEALRAASVSARRDTRAAPGSVTTPGSPGPGSGPVPPGGFIPSASSAAAPAALNAAPVAPAPWAPAPRRRRSGGPRTATEQVFSDLAGLAAIPPASYSVGEEVDGAMCLLETVNGYEVFSCSGGARHEVRVFSDEESACFYLFGVLAADAVRTGALAPVRGRGTAPVFAGEGLPRR